jgi:hypothetical protein
MGTDALSILVTIVLFLVGLWMILSITNLLVNLLGGLLVIVAVIVFIRWITNRGS